MTFTDFEFKGGILGQGCYINGFATKPGFYRCKLPALTVLSLMDLGHWQLKSVTGDIYRDEAMQEESWRIDNLLSSINDAQLRLQKVGLQTVTGVPIETYANRPSCVYKVLKLTHSVNDLPECWHSSRKPPAQRQRNLISKAA